VMQWFGVDFGYGGGVIEQREEVGGFFVFV